MKNETKFVREITPDELPILAGKALEIVALFKMCVQTVPTSWGQVLISIPKLITFFKASKPLFEEILKEIKD